MAAKRVSKKASMLDPILKLFLTIFKAPRGQLPLDRTKKRCFDEITETYFFSPMQLYLEGSTEERPRGAAARPGSISIQKRLRLQTSVFTPPGAFQDLILASSGLHFWNLRGRFLMPRPLHLQPSGKHLRLLLGLSRARPQKPKKNRKGQNQEPANTSDTKGGRRCRAARRAQ